MNAKIHVPLDLLRSSLRARLQCHTSSQRPAFQRHVSPTATFTTMPTTRSARISSQTDAKSGNTKLPVDGLKKPGVRKRKAPSAVTTKISRPSTNPLNENDPNPQNKAIARLADPTGANATVVSSSTLQALASKAVEDMPPSKQRKSVHKTDNLLEDACKHLIRIDHRLKPLIEKHHCRIFSPEGLTEEIDPFESLCSGIISQQVTGAAAKSIKAKFIALWDSTVRFPTPEHISKCSIERLRAAGLSQRKAEYIQGLAQKFTDGELSTQMLREAPYEEVLKKLTAVRGLGPWSVEMFACFALKHVDVFSLGDLGVQRGMAAFLGRDVNKLRSKGGKWKYMSEKEMLEISDRFAPYRSVFMWYMWRVEETDVSTLE